MKNNKIIMQIVPALNTGGVERGVIEISRYLVENGFESIVVSSGGVLEHLVNRSGGKHFTLSVHSKNPFKWAFIRKELEKILLNEKVDLIHACSRVPAWISMPLSLKLKIPLITSVHGRFRKGSFLKNLYNSVLLKGNYIIAISDHIKENIISISPKSKSRIKVIYRGVDLDLFDKSKISPSRIINQSRLMEIRDGKHVILMPSRPTLWKGHLKLIEALSKITEDFQCILIGAADGKSTFQQKLFNSIKKYDIGSKIKLTSSSNDIQAALMLGDIIAIPSLDPEPFGRMAIEAQALGKIVIGFNHGGLSETIIDGETGFLAEPKSAEDLAKKILMALNLSNLKREQISRKSKKNVETNFSHVKMCAETLKLYEKCLSDYNKNYKIT